jgi:hypothetical protein
VNVITPLTCSGVDTMTITCTSSVFSTADADMIVANCGSTFLPTIEVALTLICLNPNPFLGTPGYKDAQGVTFTCRDPLMWGPECPAPSAPPPPFDFPFCYCVRKQGRTAFAVAPMIVMSEVVGNYSSYTFTVNSLDTETCTFNQKSNRCDDDLKKIELWSNPECYKAVEKTYFNSTAGMMEQSPSWSSGHQVLKIQAGGLAAGMSATFTIKIDTTVCSFSDFCASTGGLSCTTALFNPDQKACPIYFSVAPGWM